MNKKIILAGGAGYLGKFLSNALTEKGYEVVILSRSPKENQSNVKYCKWDGKSLGDWFKEVDGAFAVVNLTGKSVNCRYTDDNKREIVESRTNSVRVLGEAILKSKNPPKVWVQTSSLAIYGNTGEKMCDENTPLGKGFSPSVCIAWEKDFKEIQIPKMRKIVLRIGLVLGPDGGVLEPFANITKWFLGGTIGDGKQYLSWLHYKDMNQIFLNCIEREDYEGIFNITSPHPVTNTEFMKELRMTLKRPWSPPTPSWMVKIGTKLLGTEAELVLSGRRGMPDRLLEKGFKFEFPKLGSAFEDILHENN